MLVRHLQVFAGQLIQGVAGGLGRLRRAPHGCDGKVLKILQGLARGQDADALAALPEGSRRRAVLLAIGWSRLELGKLLAGLVGRLHAPMGVVPLKPRALLAEKACHLLAHLQEAAGMLLQHRAKLGVLNVLAEKLQLGASGIVIPGDLPQLGRFVLRDVWHAWTPPQICCRGLECPGEVKGIKKFHGRICMGTAQERAGQQPATRCVVPEAGFEPARARVCPEDFKSAVSAIPPLRPGARRLYNATKSASTEAAPKEPLQEVRFTHPKALPLQSDEALFQNDETRDDHVGPLWLEPRDA